MYSRNDGNINKTDLIQLCPAMLYQMTKQECHAKEETDEEEEEETGNEEAAKGIIRMYIGKLQMLLQYIMKEKALIIPCGV